MSMYYREHGKPEIRTYTKHGRTKQSQKDECDINKLLERSAREGSLSHLDKYQAMYGDFSNYDFQEHQLKMAEAQLIFENLPAEIKREFNQSPAEFFKFVTAQENLDRLPELLPEIANRGNYFPPVNKIQKREPEALKEPETAPKQILDPGMPEPVKKPPTEE